MKKGNSDNQSGILFPVAEEISRTETDLIAMIKTTGKEKDYELIEYILNVNTQYTQVLMELNENGAMDAAYTYGVSWLTEDRFTGESNFYLYDPAGNVAGITDQDGYLWQSYRYDAFGNATFGSPQYDNEYTFNAESYNPNIQSQYLRARYYDMLEGIFLTEDTYLGDIMNPLTLNRYSYCIGNLLFYSDPSGHEPLSLEEMREEVERHKRMGFVMEVAMREMGVSDYKPIMEIPDSILRVSSEEKLKKDMEEAEEKSSIESCTGKVAGYLAYGAEEVTQDETKGFFKLYDGPTLLTDNDQRYFKDIYEEAGVEPFGALQSYGREAYPNPNGNTTYGGQSYDPREGVLRYKGIDRYGIAIGPKLQNPNFIENIDEMYRKDENNNWQLKAEKMAYGTCVDITIDLNGKTYYIPAVIIDVKEHSAPSGEIQTGTPFMREDEYVDTGKSGPIVEWYTYETDKNGGNINEGLNRFNRKASLIIYRGEVME